jgi:outer membrane protein TolC
VGETITAAKSDLNKEELSARCCDDTSRQGLIFNVISQYYGIKTTGELVQITKKAVERAERLYKATKAKQNVELATQLDVSRAEVQLSTQEVAYSTALQDLGNKQETFKVLLGLNTREKFVLIDEVVYQPSEATFKEEDLQKYIDIAMKNRPDLRAQEIRVEDASRRLRIARNDLLPTLDSNFNYSISNFGGLNNSPGVQDNAKTWSGTLTLSYPLPITSTKINIEQQAVQLRREDRSLVEKKESITRDVKNDLRNVVRLQEQIPIVKGQTESAEKKLKIANFRFDRGLADNFDIVDAENNLILAKQTITKSIADYLVAKYQLKRDMGVLKEEDLEAP